MRTSQRFPHAKPVTDDTNSYQVPASVMLLPRRSIYLKVLEMFSYCDCDRAGCSSSPQRRRTKELNPDHLQMFHWVQSSDFSPESESERGFGLVTIKCACQKRERVRVMFYWINCTDKQRLLCNLIFSSLKV